MTKYNMAMIICVALLSGCDAQDDNVKAELKELTKSVNGRVEPLKQPISYKAYSYEVESLADPFATAKLAPALRPTTGAQPDMQRNKQPLEAFALENLRMVGTVRTGGQTHAVLNSDGMLYRLKAGQYAGQNFGRVMSVDENQVVLKEMVQDSSGSWSERETILSLQDKTDGMKK